LKIIETNAELDPKYLYYYLQVTPVVSDGYKRHFGKLKNTKIPLPPLEIQKQIVEELDGYQKIIDGAKQVAESWKPRINTDPTWKAEKLESLINIRTGKLNANKAVDNGEYPFFTCSKEEYKINSYSFDCEALLLAGNNATADYDVKHYKGKFDAYQRTYVINIKDTSIISYQFLKSELEQKLPELKQKSIGNLTKYLTLGVIQDLTIPVPSLEIQKQLVEKIEAERKLVGGNKKLIEIYQQKIKEKLESLWKTEK